ncbi:MAG: glycosyltransferase [Byssovorax sp.]
MRKRVLYIGNFEPTFSTESHVRDSLRELGVEVVEAQESTASLSALDRQMGEVDLLLYTRTWGLRDPDALRWITSLPLPTVSYHLDLYAGLPRGRNLHQDPFWRTQHVFTPDGGSDGFFRAQGIQHHYLKPGVFGAECTLAEVDPATPRVEVCFVGSYDYHPEWPYRRRLVDFLAETYGRRFTKHGSPQSSVRGADLNRLYASAKVVVGDSLCLGFDHPRYWSDRIYETLGRGGFLIHPYIAGLEEELGDREHVVFYPFGDFATLERLIDYYLEHDDEREAIRRAGHERVKSSCTYVHRMREMLTVLGEHHAALRGWV